MKKIYAAFERVENAKAAVGRVKKECWNRAGLSVIVPEKLQANNDEHRYEFGHEHFLDTPYSREKSNWPALNDHEFDGIGKVKMAANHKPYSGEASEGVTINKDLVIDGLKKNKVVALIETEDEIVSKIETILESEGADYTIFD
jgi:hypothetical protein